MGYELRQSFALLPRCTDPRIWITKPTESHIQEFIRGRRTASCPLSVERPAKNELSRAKTFSAHPSEPMVNESGLPDPSPGNDGNDIYILAPPCVIQKSDVLLSTKNIASCNGQSGY